MLANVFLRLVDRGLVNGVPVVSVYLLRASGGAHECLLSSAGGSPATADSLAEGFGELGVRVERVSRPEKEADKVEESMSAPKASRRISKKKEMV